MKEKASDHAFYPEENQPNKGKKKREQNDERNLDGKGKVKWVEVLNLEKAAPYLPILRNIRGSKARIGFTMFKEIDDMAQSILREQDFFSVPRPSRCDGLLHGIKILEHLYMMGKGFGKSELSELLESKEAEYRIYDDMKTCQEKFKYDMEQFCEGFMTDEELLKRNNNISMFSPDSPRILREI